jgi:hypothetical protein
MRIVRTQKKQHNRYAEKEFLCRSVLSPIINLFPHIQIVVSAGVKLEGYSPDPMEHEERSKHVRYIRQGPGRFLGYSRDYVKKNLERSNQNQVYRPGTFNRFS